MKGGYANTIRIYATRAETVSLVTDPYGEEGLTVAVSMAPAEALQLASYLVDAALSVMGAKPSKRIGKDKSIA